MNDAAARLDPDAARRTARAVLARHRPGRTYDLAPLGPDGARASLVFVARHPREALVLKLWAPGLAAKAAAQVTRQRTVLAQLSTGDWRAPVVLFFDTDALCLGMEHVDTPSLSALWPSLSQPARQDALHRAGRWLGAFHAPEARDHPFRPKGQIAWLHRLLDWHSEGRRQIPDPTAFRAEVARLEEMFPDVRGRPAWRAVTHRDMHLDNLLPVPGGMVGLDFENDREDEPHRDLVWLLVDALARSERPDVTGYAAAIAQGYADRTTDPAARLFLQRLFALGIWANTPATPSRHHLARYDAARAVVACDTVLFT
ncbi:phosphotransferase family protein [Salipiger mucosus]|uniref:Aminoglycoside phosphotransferase domain-containing protein n=1 Tax=Salipiger mucosus DSM 16094 TaxID=1123237 RepID=S9Q7Q5_9RHOB|nr:phosphotransferase [Salipiger mucosus]EPX76042.1 hypothetical protein Salmuc_00695 [Salipiger mucosus DSM 16094]